MLVPGGKIVSRWLITVMFVAILALGFARAGRVPRTERSTNRNSSGVQGSVNESEQTLRVFIGVVLPSAAADVTARADGQIDNISVRIGDRIKRGTVIAVVDSAALNQADLAMAEAELRSAEAESRRLRIELAQTREKLERFTKLDSEQLVAAEQLRDVQYQEQLASARVNSADSTVSQKRALVDQRTTLLANAQVRAPFDGFVSSRYVEKGWSVARGSPIVRLVQPWPLRVRFAVPASDSRVLRVGLPLEARVTDESPLTGVVEAIAPEIDSASQMLIAEARLESKRDAADGALQRLIGRTVSITFGSYARSRH